MNSYNHRSHIEASPSALFKWHQRTGAFEALSPPWMKMKVLRRGKSIKDGNRVLLQLKFGPIGTHWLLEHKDFVAGDQFKDRQLSGPFRSWEHMHKFLADGNGCILEDAIDYELPITLPLLSDFVNRELDRLLAYRERILHHALSKEPEAPMNIIVSGSHGLIGQSLLPILSTSGHTIKRLVRGQADSTNDLSWDPASGTVDFCHLAGVDAVVHLAGENIASGRWTPAKKEAIKRSRCESTRKLCETLARQKTPPKVLVCASAIGFYGERDDQEVDESSEPGTGFLASLCQQWEEACAPARERGIRVVNLRFGVVMSPCGGALAKMLLPFRMGAGGIIGNGKQYMSWIAIDDIAGIISYILSNDNISGPVNAVAPDPVTNAEFTTTLGKVLSRPTICPMPAFAARFVFGQMADELLLASCRVRPTKLLASGYQFQFPKLESGLRHVLGR